VTRNPVIFVELKGETTMAYVQNTTKYIFELPKDKETYENFQKAHSHDIFMWRQTQDANIISYEKTDSELVTDIRAF
jgi:hypothetical protein